MGGGTDPRPADTAVWLGIVLPQSVRTILPVLGNQVIGMFKESSLLSTITVWNSWRRRQYRLYQFSLCRAADHGGRVLLRDQLRCGETDAHAEAAMQSMPEPIAIERRVDSSPAPVPSLLAMRGISKSYGERRILDRVDLDLAAREKVALIGPSGSGKTTILRLAIGLVKPDTGTIMIDGDVPLARAEAGWVAASRRAPGP